MNDVIADAAPLRSLSRLYPEKRGPVIRACGILMTRFVLILVAFSSSLLAQGIDAVLINGKILTVDAAFSTQQALAVRDDKIAAIGTTAEIRKLAGSKTKVIDLNGLTVIPGLIDSHMHAIRAASFFATRPTGRGYRRSRKR